MFGKRKVIGIDIGTTAIKLIEAETIPAGIKITRVDLFPLPPSGKREEIFSKIIEEEGPGGLSLSLPGSCLLSRPVSTPIIPRAKIPSIIKIEVQHKLPFPLEGVVWSYQNLGRRENALDFLVGAVKKELIDEFLKGILPLNVNIQFLDTDPFAILNLLYYKEGEAKKTVVLLEIGERSSNLIIVFGNQILIRSLTVSGRTFTETLREEMGVEVEEAERVKKEPRETILPSFLPIMESFLSEIQNSIDYWRFTQRGPEVEAFYVTGGSSRLPGLLHFLNEKLRLKVEEFNPLSKFILEGPIKKKLEENLHLFPVPLGLALRLQNLTWIDLNFLPTLYIQKKEIRKNRTYVYLSMGVASLLALSPPLFLRQEVVIREQLLNDVQDNLNEYEQYLPQIEKLNGEIKGLEDKKNSLKVMLGKRGIWLARVIDLGRTLPSRRIYLTDFSPEASALQIKGEIAMTEVNQAFGDLRQFLIRLKDLPYLKESTLIACERDKENNLLKFAINLNFKEEK